MKLRTQFILTLSFFGLILFGMLGSLVLTNRQVDQLLGQEEIAGRIEQGANELNYLSGDYLMYGESQQRSRWESSFASLSEDVSRLAPADPEQQAIVAHIKADQARLQAVFASVAAAVEESAQTSSAALDPQFLQVSWSRMEVQNQGMAFEASLLSQRLRDEADRLRQFNLILMFGLVGIFGAYLLINYYLIYQRTLRSITELQAGTAIIGSGNLDHTIAVKRPDEIGELTRGFNRMAVNLKQVTASKADLEKEILERKRAEEAVQENEERLRFILETCYIGVWDMSLEDHITIRSLEHDRIYGYTELLPEWTYEMFLEHVLPEDRSKVDTVFQHAVQTQSGWSFEFRIRRLDEQVRWIWAIGRHRFDADGVAHRVAGIVQDISERKRAEDELRATNEELDLFNRAMVGRELRMIQLKQEVNELCQSASQPPRYPVEPEKEEI